MRFIFSCFLLLVTSLPGMAPSQLSAQSLNLSSEAQISLITGTPGPELYAIFGHSALRVYDPVTRFDILYNWGIFNFNTPNFILKYAQGTLDYELSISDYTRLKAYYLRENRTIYEQVLNLTAEQKEALFALLKENYKEENRYYRYDFYYDNCSTRIRDGFKSSWGDDLKYDENYPPKRESFRNILNPYYTYPWVGFGLNLVYGPSTDQKVDDSTYMFLPVHLMEAMDHAQIKKEGRWEPLVAQKTTIVEAMVSPKKPGWFTPMLVFWSIFAIILGLSVYELRQVTWLKALDIIFFFFIGLAGLVVAFLWFLSNHVILDNNWNVLWLLPTHTLAAWLLIPRNPMSWLKTYFLISMGITILLVLDWFFLPQTLVAASLPLMLAVILRSWRVHIALKRKELAQAR